MAALLTLWFTALAVPSHAQSSNPPPESSSADDEPPLPSGLDGMDEDEPALPSGLDDSPSGDAPPLPSGLDGNESGRELALSNSPARASNSADDSDPRPARLPLQWSVFAEVRGGGRVVADRYERQVSIAEARTQLDLTQSFRPWSTSLRLVVDAIADPLAEEHLPELETGQGAIDLRTASVTFSPSEWIDVRLGRQILTWGTGDLLFINDLFPKDWLAFLIGRDVDYLKAPSDAAKLSLFTPLFDLDVVLTPVFDADRLPLRHRLSSYDPTLGRIAGEETPLSPDRPMRLVQDGELAARLHQNIGTWEVAAYGYRGFWKSPAGFDVASATATFPALAVYGASLRGPVLAGIAHAEAGYFDSFDDRQGTDPSVRNSEFRALAGYELNLGQHVTVGAQYYLEAIRHFNRHDTSVGGALESPYRHVVTTRLHVRALADRLNLSMFAFASPTDVDGYLRPTISYAWSDQWTTSTGANLFFGRDDHTFFGQLRGNSNVYAAIRFGTSAD